MIGILCHISTPAVRISLFTETGKRNFIGCKNTKIDTLNCTKGTLALNEATASIQEPIFTNDSFY